jgi:hypothetical protein
MNRRWRLRFVTSGAVLGFVVVHRDFEHVVATDANAMDFRARFFAGLRFRAVPGVFALLRFAHRPILARRASAWHPAQALRHPLKVRLLAR